MQVAEISNSDFKTHEGEVGQGCTVHEAGLHEICQDSLLLGPIRGTWAKNVLNLPELGSTERKWTRWNQGFESKEKYVRWHCKVAEASGGEQVQAKWTEDLDVADRQSLGADWRRRRLPTWGPSTSLER